MKRLSEVFRKITNFQLLERKCYEVFKKDGISKKRVCRATILLRLHSSARTFKIQVQFFIRANFQNISKLTLNHFHKVNVNNCYGKCFSQYLLFFQAIFTIGKIIIRSRHGFDLQNNVEVTFQWMHCFCYQISQYWFAKKSLYCVCV